MSLLLLAQLVQAQTPLKVEHTPIFFPSLEEASAWTASTTSGEIKLESQKEASYISYSAGTKGALCSSPVPTSGGRTLHLQAMVRGDISLGEAAGIQLYVTKKGERLLIGRRRIEPGDNGWEELELLATAPPASTEALLCFDFQMLEPSTKGGLWVKQLQAESIRAFSSSRKLPLQKIILITVESLRWDHLSMNGYARTTSPNLDRLAAIGARFDKHYATAPYTHPSLASLITSQFPTDLGFADNLSTFPDLSHTAAEIFAGAGYVTAAFNAQYILANRYGFTRGFHYFRNWPNNTPAGRLNDELIPWLQSHQDSIRLTSSPTAVEGMAQIPSYLFNNNQYDRRHYVAGYDGDIAWWDSELGRLLEFLKLQETDTLVMLTADHGESMTDHKRFFCHGSLYQHDIHVPLVIAAPGRIAPSVVDSVSSHLDLLPTLMDYAGLEKDIFLGGQSLKKQQDSSRMVAAVVGRAEKLRYAVRGDSPFKLILDQKLQIQEAYLLSSDPTELHNLAASPTSALLLYLKKAQSWLKAAYPPAVIPPASLDTETREQLRAMGYEE